MLRKLSKLVMKPSEGSLQKEQIVRVGRASKVGTDHGNEDEIRVSDSLGGSDGEEELDLSEALTSFLSMVPTEQDLFIDRIMFVACFDGHGGPGCAKFMGETLHKKLLKILKSKEISSEEQFNSVKKDIILETFREAEEEWLKKAAIINDTSGACAVMCLMLHRELILGHCGDCRAVVRNPNGSTIELTKDHRAVDPDEMARIVAAGGAVIRERVMGVLAPSRSFGDLDVKQKCPPGVVIAVPDINVYSVPEETGKFAFMILATDGVFDVISSKSACDFVARVLERGGSPEMAAEKLVQAAAKHNTDDVSCVIVVWSEEVVSADEPLPPSRKGSKDSTSMRALINATKKSEEAAALKTAESGGKSRPSTPNEGEGLSSPNSPFPAPKLVQLGKTGSVAKLKAKA